MFSRQVLFLLVEKAEYLHITYSGQLGLITSSMNTWISHLVITVSLVIMLLSQFSSMALISNMSEGALLSQSTNSSVFFF
jgi:hypothetical protein